MRVEDGDTPMVDGLEEDAGDMPSLSQRQAAIGNDVAEAGIVQFDNLEDIAAEGDKAGARIDFFADDRADLPGGEAKPLFDFFFHGLSPFPICCTKEKEKGNQKLKIRKNRKFWTDSILTHVVSHEGIGRPSVVDVPGKASDKGRRLGVFENRRVLEADGFTPAIGRKNLKASLFLAD